MNAKKSERRTKAKRYEICVMLNNCITNDPCAICGMRTDPSGVDWFLYPTRGLVCEDCAKKYAPALYYLLYGFAVLGRVGSHGALSGEELPI